jgi:DNA-binding response OmpR family regulator
LDLRLGTILKQPWLGVDGMTGVDLAREVQALQPELVVLLVSGYADNVDIDLGHVWLAKPFRAEELTASLAAP